MPFKQWSIERWTSVMLVCGWSAIAALVARTWLAMAAFAAIWLFSGDFRLVAAAALICALPICILTAAIGSTLVLLKVTSRQKRFSIAVSLNLLPIMTALIVISLLA